MTIIMTTVTIILYRRKPTILKQNKIVTKAQIVTSSNRNFKKIQNTSPKVKAISHRTKAVTVDIKYSSK
jgi:hypothetical protein